jgi:uncharacterized protein (TIGR03083 family)
MTMHGEAAVKTENVNVQRVPQITHREWAGLGATEFERVIDLLRSLTPEEWAAPTACPPWDVRAMAGHMLGMAEGQARVREFARMARAASNTVKRGGGAWIDALTDLQVREHASMTTAELVARFAEVAPAAVRARRRTPAPLRRAIRMKQDPPFERERFSLGYILDTLSTRDPWTHRLDISRAIGQPMVLTAEHDGRLIADVVVEWSRRHGQPFSLALTGPAGGQWSSGAGGEHIEMDALDFCWALSGRAPGSGLTATLVPF